MDIIKTSRLILKTTKNSDIPKLIHILCDHNVMKTTMALQGFEVQKAKKFIQKSFNFNSNIGFSPLILKNTREIIGYAGLIPTTYKEIFGYEIGYVLAKKFWHQGYATEIAKAQIEYGFNNLGNSIIFASTWNENDISKHILTKVGMKIFMTYLKDGKLRTVYYINMPSTNS